VELVDIIAFMFCNNEKAVYSVEEIDCEIKVNQESK